MQVKTFGATDVAPIPAINEPYNLFLGTKLISATLPEYFATLSLAVDQPVQCVVYEPVSQQFFAAQAINGTNGTKTPYETIIISRCDATGAYLDSMTLINAGHGMSLAVQDVSGVSTIWMTYNQGADMSSTPAYDLLKFPYAVGTFDRTTLANTTLLPKLDAGCTLEAFDWTADWCVVRLESGNSETYVRRKISELQAGIDVTYGTIVLQELPPTTQGYCIINDTLFRYIGATNGESLTPPDPAIIQQYSWQKIIRLDQQAYPNLGRDNNGQFPDNTREPESITQYRDPVTGYASIIFCVTLGKSGNRTHKVWRVPNIGNQFVIVVTIGRVGSAIVGTSLVG